MTKETQLKGKKTLAEQYNEEEKKSLTRKNTPKQHLGMKADQIRKVLHELLSVKDKILLSSIANVIAKEKNYDTLKTGVRIQSVVDAKKSDLKIIHDDDGRRWITKK